MPELYEIDARIRAIQAIVDQLRLELTDVDNEVASIVDPTFVTSESNKISGVVVSIGKIWISVSNATFTDSITLATYRTDAALPTPTETHDYAYIKVPFDGSAPQWKDTADFIAGGNNDANAEWFCVAGMSGDIHVDRA